MKKEFMEKYNPVFVEMNKMSGLNDDISVCFDKLKYMNDKYHGREVAGNDEYPVPEDFDYDVFDADLKEAEDEDGENEKIEE